MLIQGKFIPVMLTPFDKNGMIDYHTLAKLTAYYIEAGATGLFANCLSSEMFELTEEERISVTAFVVKEASGVVPVFSTGTFGGSINSQADFCKRIYDTGVTAVVAISSILAEENEPDEILHERINELFRLSDVVTFGFYECPVPYKRLLSASQLRIVVESGRVIYYKDTSLCIESVKEKLKETAEYPHFELYDAYMVNAVASLKAGAGISCIQGNFVPELIRWIAENFNDTACEQAIQQAQQFLVDTMNVMHDAYPAVAKYFLQMRGFPIGLTTRRDVGTISNTMKRNLDKLKQDYELLQNKLSIRTVFA